MLFLVWAAVVVKMRRNSLLLLLLPSKLVYKQVKASLQGEHAESQKGACLFLVALSPHVFRKQ